VIEFKRGVYQQALVELSRFVFRHPADRQPKWSVPSDSLQS
jgi:hypothetical protein